VHTIISIYKTAAEDMRTIRRNFNRYQNNPHWWDSACSKAKREKYSLLRRFRWTNEPADFHLYKNSRRSFKNLCHAKKILYQNKKRKVLIDSRKYPQDFWSVIKGNRFTATTRAPINPNEWIRYFQSLLFKESENPLHNFDVHSNVNNNDHADYILNSPITDDEIETSVSKLKRGKSQGKDGIGAEFYINTNML